MLTWLVPLALAAPHDLDLDRIKHPHPLPPPSRGVQTDWDVQRYDIAVVLDPSARRVTGDIDITAAARTDGPGALLLHASDPTITAITVDGANADWSRTDDEVLVTIPAGHAEGDEVAVRVRYTAPGNSGGVDLGLNWGDPIFSFTEPSGARKWLVVYDDPADKASLRWTITAPSDRVVVANGELVSSDTADGLTTWVYELAGLIPTYLMVLHAGSYAHTVDDSGEVPVHTWAFGRQIDQATADFANTGEMISTLSALYGPYPWTHYANVTAPFGGAMEHTTATTFGDDIIGSGYAEIVNVHELGHHWWGDWVTLAEWPEIWLNEGLASYTEDLWVEAAYGEEEARAYRENQRATYLEWQNYEGVGTLYDPTYMWGGLVYEKGALVVHMLRTVLGDDAFFAGLQAYGDAHGGDIATSEDLRLAMESTYGDDLSWFFDEWLYVAGDPEYVVGITQATTEDGQWQVDLHIAQDTAGTWIMPIPIELTLADGATVQTVLWSDGAEAARSLCLDAEVTDMDVDPDNDVLMESLSRDDARFSPLADACGSPTVGGDDTGGDTSDDTGYHELDDNPAGCGCSSSPARAPWVLWVGLIGLALRRRLRRLDGAPPDAGSSAPG